MKRSIVICKDLTTRNELPYLRRVAILHREEHSNMLILPALPHRCSYFSENNRKTKSNGCFSVVSLDGGYSNKDWGELQKHEKIVKPILADRYTDVNK